jgi:hypothetical protein
MQGYITISRISYPITHILLLMSRIPSPIITHVILKEIAILIIIYLNNIFIYLENLIKYK